MADKPQECYKITIIVEGGVVVGVKDLPENIILEIRDYDIMDHEYFDPDTMEQDEDESYCEVRRL